VFVYRVKSSDKSEQWIISATYRWWMYYGASRLHHHLSTIGS